MAGSFGIVGGKKRKYMVGNKDVGDLLLVQVSLKAGVFNFEITMTF